MKITTDYYSLTGFPKLIIVECCLSWDERVADSFTADINKMVADKYTTIEHGVLLDLRAWELGTPQAESFMHDFLITNDRLQQLHFAIVADQSALKWYQIEQMFNDIYNPNIKVFDEISVAESWLGSFGYIR